MDRILLSVEHEDNSHFRDQGRDLGDPIHGVQRSHKSDSQLGEGGEAVIAAAAAP